MIHVNKFEYLLNMRRLYFTFLALMFSTFCFSQELVKESFDESIMDLDAQKNLVEDNNGTPCALVKVQLLLKDVVFENDFIVKQEFKTNEYWVYMAEGAGWIDIKHPDYQKLHVIFENKLKSKATYNLVIKVPVKDSSKKPEPKQEVKPGITKTKMFGLHLGGMYEIGGLQGVGALVGISIKALEMDFNYIAGLKKSENVYWNNTTVQSSSSYCYQYTPSYIGGKLGCRIKIGGPVFCITPQLSIGAVMLNGKVVNTGTNNPNATSGYATVASGGLSVGLRFANVVGIFVTPQYNMALSKSDLFTRVEEISPDIKSFANGFNLQAGLYVTF